MANANLISAPPVRLALWIWGLGAVLYFGGFFQRVAPAVMTGELMAEFGLSAAALGNLSAFYFYSYVVMQIPTGVIADRWGPRRLLTAGAAVAAAGSMVFALAPNLWLANLGRLLIGGSVAVAFVAMLKLATHWFHPRYFARMSGLALFVGTIGAVGGGVPLRLMVVAYGWRPVMAGASLLLALLTVAIWMVVRDDPAERGYASYYVPEKKATEKSVGTFAGIFGDIAKVFSYRNIRLFVLIPGGVTGPVLTFAGLWGVPYLVSARGFTPTAAAAVTSAMLIALAVGGLLFGAWSDAVRWRKLPYATGVAIVAASWATVILYPALPSALLVAALVLSALGSGCMVLSFAFCKESVPGRLGGTATGVANMGAMLGPMIMQPLVGFALDRNWHGESESGARIYDLAAYHSGFLIMVAWTAVSLVLMLFTRETRGTQKA